MIDSGVVDGERRLSNILEERRPPNDIRTTRAVRDIARNLVS